MTPKTRISDHATGQPFARAGYDNIELAQFVQEINRISPINFSLRTLQRAEDLHVNFNEIAQAVSEGLVKEHEVGPSRSEMRLEIQAEKGDIAKHRIVVWLSINHDLYAEDIR